MRVALGDLRAALQFFVVVVLDAERAADLVDHVLIGSGVVAAGRFVAGRFGRLPVGVDVTGSQARAGAVVLLEVVAQLFAAGVRRRGEAPMPRLDGMPRMSATVLRGRSRLGFLVGGVSAATTSALARTLPG